MLPLVSIIIVSYKTGLLLRHCLESIFRGRLSDQIEIIVVDNHSTDGTVEMLATRYPSVKVIVNSENLGFAAAVNQGLKICIGKYVLLLNPDTEVAKDTVFTMQRFLKQKTDAGAVGCKILLPDSSLQPSAYKLPTLLQAAGNVFCINKILPYALIRRYFGRYIGKYWGQFDAHDQIKQSGFVVGACMMLKKAAICRVGLLDERFFLYLEENDYCCRLKQMHWNTYFIPTTYVVHHIGQSSKLLQGREIFELYKSMLYYFMKHKGFWEVCVLRLILCVGLFPRFVFAVLRGNPCARWYAKTLYRVITIHNILPRRV